MTADKTIGLQRLDCAFLDELVQRAKRGAGYFEHGFADIRLGSLAIYIEHRSTPIVWVVDHALTDGDPENWEHEIRRSSRGWRLVVDDRAASPEAQLESALALLNEARVRQAEQGIAGARN